jgi:hypothetical protein
MPASGIASPLSDTAASAAMLGVLASPPMMPASGATCAPARIVKSQSAAHNHETLRALREAPRALLEGKR